MISAPKIDTTPPVRANPQAAAGMSFAILPALIPNIQDIYSVYFSAFESDPMGRLMLDVLFPGGFEGEEFRKAHAKATQDYWGIAAQQYTWKVIETQTNAIAGMILGDVYQLPRTVEERKNLGVPWLEGEKREKAEAILNPLWEVRERIFGGRPYICECAPFFPFFPFAFTLRFSAKHSQYPAPDLTIARTRRPRHRCRPK